MLYSDYESGLIISPYDKRDYKFKDLVFGVANILPDTYSSDVPDYIFDQGKSQMCCACSLSSVRYLQEKEQSGLDEPFSPLFIYGNREENEYFEGMTLRGCLNKAKEGCILYKELPGYGNVFQAVKKVSEKKQEYMEKAAPFKIDSYYKCFSRTEIQQAIMTTKAVLLGIPTFNSLRAPRTENGEVKYNPLTDRINYGGHCVVIFGWRTDPDGTLWWKMLNSWGDGYGNGGWIWLNENYPFIDGPYAIVDETYLMKIEEYKNKFYQE